MTLSLSNATNAQWQSKWRTSQVSKRDNWLNKPIFPRAETMPEWEHVLSHTHPWGQLTYTSNGVLTVVTDVGKFVIPPNKALWLPPNVAHETYCRFGGEFRSVYIDNQFVERIGTNVKTVEVSDLLRSLILAVCDWPHDYELTAKRQRLIDVFIDTLEEAPENQLMMPLTSDPRILPIVSELIAEPGSSKTLTQWGQQVGASGRTINRLFQAHLNMSFSAWRQKLKALKAVEMLATNMPHQHIAQQLGFESDSAFNTSFKKHFGISPGQFAKQHNKVRFVDEHKRLRK